MQLLSGWTTRKILMMIIGVSVVARIAAALYLGNSVEVLPGTYDQMSYHELALRVLSGHGFSFGRPSWPLTAAGAPTAHWSFLYTFYLSAVYAIFGENPLAARLIQAVVVGVLQPYFAYRLGRHVFDERTGLLAAAFTAVYIYFIYYAATLMTEPFYITAVLGALLGLLHLRRPAPDETRTALAVGAALGIAVLLRQLFLMLIPFLLLWLWSVRWWDARRRLAGTSDDLGLVRFHLPWRPTAIIVAFVVLLILPFTLYNYGRFDRFVLLNTNAGYAFFWANHPIYGTQFQAILPPEMGSYGSLIPESLRDLDEPALEKALMERGMQFVIDDPIRYMQLSLSRVPIYFMFWPSADSGTLSNISRVGSFGLFLPFMLAGLIFSFAHRETRQQAMADASLLLLFAVLYSAMHLLSWSLVRYRLPVDAVLLVYAGLAVSAIWSRLQRNASSASS
ncbi:MAG TPA: glycosyltransferase family 39 protein [Promineifilum sp.]|nr:glycosyltransferase family 39 protein [Promineifilum sp.]HRQ11843.1 glycosyltransferase family 39 protein [Promineifilum sp.]